ncbi:MAG TPA: hypothetical protein VHN99_06820 [Deinococcales bacterium]|nr:hypothetical protein [Deinococcales bacterium]
MGRTVTAQEFANFARGLVRKLEATPRGAMIANARLLESVLREHLVRDNLPLDALSPSWLAHKASHGYDKAHLRYTGQYLGNLALVPLKDGAFIGTSRPVPSPLDPHPAKSGFPRGQWQSLPQLLEAHYPVWRLTLDECQAHFKANVKEALAAAVDGRSPHFKEQ